jgi:hypothetical protein
MAVLIDIGAARVSRNAPDPNCLSTDSDGHLLFMFAIGYRHNGRRFSLDIWARSESDAAEQLASIRATLWLEGRVIAVDSMD